MPLFNPLPDLFSPLTTILNTAFRAGSVVGSNIRNGQPVTQNVASVISQPLAPITINNPAPKQSLVGSIFGGDFKIGFVEKNVIIIGALAIGGLIIWKKVK